MHAMAGGVLSVLQGGKFGHGVASAGLSKGFDANFNMESGDAGAFFAETVIVAVVGGTISEITGGKFANGAATAAFQYLFNEMGQRKREEENQWAQFRVKMQNLIDSPPSLPQGVVDFAAGFGDTVSFGLSAHIRNLYEIDGGINYGSSEYSTGIVSGMVGSLGTVVAGGTAINIGIRTFGGANQLYHFASAANAASIYQSGVIYGSSSGLRGLYGAGVYASAFTSARYATIQGAVSTQAMITINSRTLATSFPGTFRFPGNVVLK